MCSRLAGEEHSCPKVLSVISSPGRSPATANWAPRTGQRSTRCRFRRVTSPRVTSSARGSIRSAAPCLLKASSTPEADGDGHRALLSIHVPGDFIDLHTLFLQESGHDVHALTHAAAADGAIADLRELVWMHPAINEARWINGLVEASIFHDWPLNVGRRDAPARMAHRLCEISGLSSAFR